MTEACDSCLRRAYLVGHLAPRIAGMLERPGRRVSGVLGLAEEDLVAAAAPRRGAEARAFLKAFDGPAERESLRREDVIALCAHTPDYPAGLGDLSDPPAVVFGLGQPGLLETLRHEPAVTVVGTRRPSPYGLEVARALGRGLGASGVPVISGLAMGIDASAHRGCLEGGGSPVAVVAGGPDVVYPRRHRRLHEQVREAGLVLAELPPASRPFRWSFPARNRIMAALARMTVVVEAAEPSGSLITTDFARDLGRAVAAVPGRVTSTVARGANNLLRDGAVPVTSTEDVLDELFGVGVRGPPPAFGAQGPEPGDDSLRAALRATERLGSVDAVTRELGWEPAAVRAALGRLEAEGYLVRDGLGGWERAAR